MTPANPKGLVGVRLWDALCRRQSLAEALNPSSHVLPGAGSK